MRPDRDQYFIEMAELVASRSTCARRAVGCVLVSRRNHVLATGYNGVPAGMAHCNHIEPKYIAGAPVPGVVAPYACAAATARSGTNLDGCLAVHAEQNAILQCADVQQVERAYVTTFPCSSCAKLLLNTGCREVVCVEDYADSAGRDMWLKAGRVARLYNGEPHMLQRDVVELWGREWAEWRVCLACTCLNLASHRVARPAVMRVLQRYTTPEELVDDEGASEFLALTFAPLGLTLERARRALAQAQGAIDGLPYYDWLGVGRYAQESVRVFVYGARDIDSTDRKVAAWVRWAKSNGL